MSDSIPARLLSQAQRRPHAAAYHVRERGVWRATSWRTYSELVTRAGRSLIALGVDPNQTVTILGFNRPEWVIMDVAAMGCGAAPAGIYATCSAEEVAYIINHSECPLVLVENDHQWQKVAECWDQLSSLKHVVVMEGDVDDERVMSWDQFLERGDSTADREYLDRVEALQPDQMATLIYTSGTTGPPKAVMLSHGNLAWTADAGCKLVDMRSSDAIFSYLPLSHIAEQMFSIHTPITSGGTIYFAESLERVPDNLKEVQPTVFFGVPRIWEKFQAGISRKLNEATGVKAKLVAWAQRVSREVTQLRQAGQAPTLPLKIQHRLADRLVYSKLKQAIGLGRARVCVSGAAPIARDVLEFFSGFDLLILEVYGQSEDCGPTSFNQPGQFRFGTVGPVVPGVEVRLGDDSEVLVRGPNVFLGYYKDPEATAETLDGEWLCSGDLGAFEDGFLKIVGRKKEIIITAGGKNIAPKNIEAALKGHELVNAAVVIGDRRKFLSALLTLDPDAAADWAARHGESLDGLSESERLQQELQRFVDAEVNPQFARVEQIKKFQVLDRNFTVETGELTPTLKIKRRVINRNFSDVIESMYQ